MRNRLERRRLTLRAAALCIVLVLLCGCLLPAFAEGTALPDSVPGQTQTEEEADEPALDDGPELLPAVGGDPIVDDLPDEILDEIDEPALPDLPVILPAEGGKPVAAGPVQEYFGTTFLFWLSEADEADGGLPYAELTVGSGSELLLPEEPEAEGKTFRYWYSRDEEGNAVRFVPDDEPLWPEEDSECSLYAYFAADTQEEPILDEDETPVLPDVTEEEPAEEGPLPEEEQPEEILPAEDADPADEDENALPADDEEADDPDVLAGNSRTERAAVFLLKTPTSLPESNDPSQWAPDNSECKWIGSVKISRNTVWDNNKNIFNNVSSYIVSWPDNTTGDVWTLEPGDTYWSAVVNEIWDEYKDTIEAQTGISGLTQDDLESIVVTPYKISKNNNTTPDKHIDCTISVKSKRTFTARFNVRAPGAAEYATVASHEYGIGERVEEATANIKKEIEIGGVTYVFDGWYREESGPVIDQPGGGDPITQDEWDEGYLPSADELENGVVNFYAHYVLADAEPDLGVELSFPALPLLLGAGAAAGCINRKKKEEEE